VRGLTDLEYRLLVRDPALERSSDPLVIATCYELQKCDRAKIHLIQERKRIVLQFSHTPMGDKAVRVWEAVQRLGGA